MSIFPATDLVSEVAQAADPTRRSAAVARLNEMSLVSPRTVDRFSEFVADNRKEARGGISRASHLGMTSGYGAPAARPLRPGDVAQKFEAFIIQSSLETILPKSEAGIFGHGVAGGVWRSMVAEQLGEQIAKAGGLGLRKLLDRKGEAHVNAAKNMAPAFETS